MGQPTQVIQIIGSLGDKNAVKSVNGVKPDENGNVEISALTDEMEQLAMLVETDMLPAVHDTNGAILTDKSCNIILRY